MGTCLSASNRNKETATNNDSDIESSEIDLEDFGFDVRRLQRDTFNGSVTRQRPRLREVQDSLEHLRDDSLNSNNDEGLNRSVSIRSYSNSEFEGGLIEGLDQVLDGDDNDYPDSESSGAENVDDISHISFEEGINPSTHVYIDDDTCSICVSEFDDREHSPEILPCGHTFCSFCVRKMSKRHKFVLVKCPLDRKLHKLKTRKLDDGTSNSHYRDYTIRLNDAVIPEEGREQRSYSHDNIVITEDVPNERNGTAYVRMDTQLTRLQNRRVPNTLDNVVIIEDVPNEHDGPAYVSMDSQCTGSQNRGELYAVNDAVNPDESEHDHFTYDYHSFMRPHPRQFTDNRRHAVVFSANSTNSGNTNSIVTPDSAINTVAPMTPLCNIRNVSPGRTVVSNAHARRLPRQDIQQNPAPRMEIPESYTYDEFGRRFRGRRHLPVTGNLDNLENIRNGISDDTGALHRNEANLYSDESLIHRGYQPIQARNHVTVWHHAYDGSIVVTRALYRSCDHNELHH